MLYFAYVPSRVTPLACGLLSAGMKQVSRVKSTLSIPIRELKADVLHLFPVTLLNSVDLHGSSFPVHVVFLIH